MSNQINPAKKSLTIKDLVTTGIFSAIFLVFTMIGGIFFAPNPVLTFYMPMGAALLCGPVYLLMIAKVQKRWSVTILGIIMGIIWFVTGMHWAFSLGYIGMGIIADLVAGAGDYRNKAVNLLSYMLMSLGGVYTYVVFFIDPQGWASTMLENGTVLFFVTDRTGIVHELSLDVYCMDFDAPVLRAGINGTFLHVEAYDNLSGIAAIYVNDELYTTLDDGELNVRIDRLTDDAYLYIDALDNAGNWTDYVVLSNPFYEEAEPEPTPTPSTDTGKDQHDEHCPSDCDCRKEQTSTAQPSNNTGSGGNTGNSSNIAASGGKNSTASSQPVQSASPAAEPVTKEDGTGFTQNGNSVTRDLLYDKYSNKQFITIETRNGETFYLVIDYDKPLDEDGERYETYFLNLVDEADLLALVEGDKQTPVCSCTTKCEAGAVNTSCEVCKTNMTECTGKEKVVEKVPDTPPEPEVEPEPEKKSSGGTVALLLLLLLGGGALYWFKFRKKKPDAKGPVDLDDYDYGEDEDDADYETEPDEGESADAAQDEE